MGKYEVVVIHEHHYEIKADTMELAMAKGDELAKEDKDENDENWVKHQTTFGYDNVSKESKWW